ncbi:unnamed protein product, partial [Symbiodinium pilosum]
MGNYYFTSCANGSKTKVEYTFGYKKNAVPFVPSISEEEVRAVQRAWARAIKTISKTYLSGGDYVAEAAKAAGELYGYGHTNVLFKPTKDAGFAINGGKGWADVV